MKNGLIKRIRMKLKIIIILLFIILSVSCIGQRYEFDSILDKAILIDDGFAGQSITLTKEGSDYYIVRQFFGSGIPVIRTTTYKAKIINGNKITFSEVAENKGAEIECDKPEEFILIIDEDGTAKLYLNGLKLEIEFTN